MAHAFQKNYSKHRNQEFTAYSFNVGALLNKLTQALFTVILEENVLMLTLLFPIY